MPVRLTALIPILMTLAPLAGARAPVYLPDAQGTYLLASYLDLQSSDLDANAGEIGGERSALDAQYRAKDSAWRFALGHEYDALDIGLTGAEPETNGDLHTLHIATAWTQVNGNGELSVTLAPSISTSSNVMKDPGEWNSDSAQLWAAILWQHRGQHWDWVLGVAHDFRFGESRFYPVAGLNWQSDRVSIWATYPDLVFNWDINNHWLLTFDLSPDGNEWHAFDSELENGDEFQRDAWQAELRMSFQTSNGLRVGLSAGYQFDQRWRMRLENGEQFNRASDGNAFLGFHLGWYGH